VDDALQTAPEPSDEALARWAKDGGADALDVLVRRYLRPVHAVIASLLVERADVEDAVQETFRRAITGLGGYRPEQPFAPWLYQIARNVARTRPPGVARWPTEPLPAAGLVAPAPGPDVRVERAELRRIVDDAIAALPEQRRTAFRLHDVDGYTTDEAARIMDLSAGTVRSHVHHARRALRVTLAARLGRVPTEGGQ
jgi:RNA polymerase sigma-70 factor, ECF subfamily